MNSVVVVVYLVGCSYGCRTGNTPNTHMYPCTHDWVAEKGTLGAVFGPLPLQPTRTLSRFLGPRRKVANKLLVSYVKLVPQ